MDMLTKIQTLWPEIILMFTAAVVAIVGLSPSVAVRKSTARITLLGLLLAAAVAMYLPHEKTSLMAQYVKIMVCAVGLIMLLTNAEVPDETGAEPDKDRHFDPGNTSRGEFFGLFLLSLSGVMLCAGADSLVWLFLALELTSLPTYIMVAAYRSRIEAPEAGVKYFFLGAFAAAIFLYGFAWLYGATGQTTLAGIKSALAADISQKNTISNFALIGMALSIIGISFKIAAVPMHAYVADVYQGAATPVTAFLGFVPKLAGFVALILLVDTIGWPLVDRAPEIAALLWIIAVVTMFAGNTLALRQRNFKRMLAYSSVAHSGYMVVGLLAGPGDGAGFSNGIAAVLVYIAAYGIINLGAFAVLGLLQRRGEDVEEVDDLKGLVKRQPLLAAMMAVFLLSLTGFPPLVSFWGKLYLFGSAASAAARWPEHYHFYIWLAIFGVVNSAIAAVYYLRVIGICFLHDPEEETTVQPLPWRTASVGASLMAVLVLTVGAAGLVAVSRHAAGDFTLSPVSNPSAGAQTPATPAATAIPAVKTGAAATSVR